jgi:hypothetical protein
MRKIFYSIVSIACVISACVCAEDKIIDQEFSPGMPLTPDKTEAGYNLPGRFEVNDSYNLFVSASFIYSWVKEEGLELGKELITSDFISNNYSSIQKNMDFKYEPGFKVALGKNFLYDDWNVFAQYTRLHLSENKRYNNPTVQYYEPFWLSQTLYPTSTVTDMKASWRFKYDVIDLLFQRPCYIGKSLVINPTFGARGIFISQRYDIDYGSIGHSQNKSDSWGVGPRADVQLNWLLNSGFYFFANSSLGLYYQHINTQSEQVIFSVASNAMKLKQIKNTMIPNIELASGLAWGNYLSNEKWYLEVLIGYEFSMYYQQDTMRKLVDTSHNTRNFEGIGDLKMQGLIASMRLDF